MIRRPPRSTPLYSSAASDVYKRQDIDRLYYRYRCERAIILLLLDSCRSWCPCPFLSPKFRKGRQERTRPHLVPKQSGLLHCMQHRCMRQASSTSSAQEFPSRYPIVVNHHAIPSNPLRVSSGNLPHVLLIAVGSGPIPPWYYNAPPGGGSESNCLLYTSPSPRDGLLSRMPSSA